METASRRYGAWFSKPGNGICHQVHFESFSVPGRVRPRHRQPHAALRLDGHAGHRRGRPRRGGGDGRRAVSPGHAARRRACTLTGRLRPWVSAKDVILELLRRYTVRGGSGKIFEYAGPGAADALAAPARDHLQHGRRADAHHQRVPVGRGDARVLPAPRARGGVAAARRRRRRRVRRGDRARPGRARAAGRAARLAGSRRARWPRSRARRSSRSWSAPARTARGRTCGR